MKRTLLRAAAATAGVVQGNVLLSCAPTPIARPFIRTAADTTRDIVQGNVLLSYAPTPLRYEAYLASSVNANFSKLRHIYHTENEKDYEEHKSTGAQKST